MGAEHLCKAKDDGLWDRYATYLSKTYVIGDGDKVHVLMMMMMLMMMTRR